MKSLLMVAALLAGLAAPALADDATTTAPLPPAQAEVALAPSQDGAAPQAQPAGAEPMALAPLESNAAPPSRGGCQSKQTTEYLTN